MNLAKGVTVSQRALGIPELLEIVLKHLSLGDLLYNAQAVSPFWRNGIYGSLAMKKKWLLTPNVVSEDDAESRLYMDQPQVEDRNKPRQDYRIAHIIGNNNPSLANIRRHATQDPHGNFRIYMTALVFMFRHIRVGRAAFNLNSDKPDFHALALQVRSSVVHPFIRLGLWANNGCFWTGHGSHAILYILDTIDAKRFRFATISDIILRMRDMVEDCPTATWIESSLSNPAFTTLSISARSPVDQPLTQINGQGTAYVKDGLTIRDLLMLLANVAIKALEAYEDLHIRSIWGRVVHGVLEAESAQKAEQKIAEVRLKTQPGIVAAKELRMLLELPPYVS